MHYIVYPDKKDVTTLLDGNKYDYYYHYDGKEFDVGEVIQKHYDIADDVYRVFSTDSVDPRDRVYMVERRDDDRFCDYEYVYKVAVPKSNPTLHRFSEYSPVITTDYVDRCLKCQDNRSSCIRLFYHAYTSESDQYKSIIQKLYDLDISYTDEYITSCCYVVSRESLI